MAKTRCSNCEKSVSHRDKLGKVFTTRDCKATGERITGQSYYAVRRCNEFLPRMEYILQFENPLDRAVEMIEQGKKIKEIVDPL